MRLVRASSERISATFLLWGDTTPKDVLLFGRILTTLFELTNSLEGSHDYIGRLSRLRWAVPK
jgi:hypothetical protein